MLGWGDCCSLVVGCGWGMNAGGGGGMAGRDEAEIVMVEDGMVEGELICVYARDYLSWVCGTVLKTKDRRRDKRSWSMWRFYPDDSAWRPILVIR